MIRKHRSMAARASAAVSAAVVFSLLGAATAWAAPPPTTATITDPSTNKPLTSGGPNTTFTITLPPVASCSGDTSTKGYHVYSYIVLDSSINMDPSTLQFTAADQGPAAGTPGFPLFQTGGAGPYYSANTAPNTGQVIQIPNFDYSPFGATDLPSGLYDVGIACTKPATGGNLTVDKFWNVQENIVSDPNSTTGITSWTVVAGSTTPEISLAVVLPLSAVAVLGLGTYIVMRRRRDDDVVAAI